MKHTWGVGFPARQHKSLQTDPVCMILGLSWNVKHGARSKVSSHNLGCGIRLLTGSSSSTCGMSLGIAIGITHYLNITNIANNINKTVLMIVAVQVINRFIIKRNLVNINYYRLLILIEFIAWIVTYIWGYLTLHVGTLLKGR